METRKAKLQEMKKQENLNVKPLVSEPKSNKKVNKNDPKLLNN